MNRLLIVVIISTFCKSAFAQTHKKDNKPTTPSIGVLARAQKDRILLRWAVNQPVAWKQANKYGFIVERYTVLRDNKALVQPEKKILTNEPLKPRPLFEWETIAQFNDNAAIIAQCIYGDSSKAAVNQTNSLDVITNSADALQQRFAFSLIAADRSFEAACMAGWGWVDSSVRENEKYLYRIYAALPAISATKIDTSGAFISLKDNSPLPTPKDLHASFGNKSALLIWDAKLLETTYIGYYIERSEDGKVFNRVSDLPIANLGESDSKLPKRIMYVDSLQTNEKTFFYRIAGVTNFGETGPVSEVVKGQGKDVITNIPRISSAIVMNNDAELEWEMLDNSDESIDHFEVSRSDKANGSYKVVNERIGATKRKVIVNKLLPSNYFTVTAVTKKGARATSFPYLVQPIDSFPPAPPIELSAIIDSSGHVTLKWAPNKEPDLLGYQVFRANLKGEEMGIVTKLPIKRNSYRDTVNLKSLNSEVYYAVIALDKRYNQSRSSAIIRVQKPDKVPPSPPVFAKPVIEETKVKIKWFNSNSVDIDHHTLYKKDITKRTNLPWTAVKQFTDTSVQQYIDKEMVEGNVYAYLITAVDKANNETPARLPLTVHVPKSLIKPAVKELRVQADRQLKHILINWKYEEKEVVEQQVYKATKGSPMTLWKVVPVHKKEIVDTEVSPGNIYKYAVREVFKDGTFSAWKEVSVEY